VGWTSHSPRSSEVVVAGGHGEFMTVRHLTVCGTNFEIGREIGELAIERYGQTAERLLGNGRFVRARRSYFQRQYPIHWERMQGVAAAFGVHPEDDRFDLSNLIYNGDIPMLALGRSSVMYFPPSTTATGDGYLSRNYAVSVDSMADVTRDPLPAERLAQLPPAIGEPYVLELHPEHAGYRSIAIQAFDLLSGTLDGMNEEGLVVSILADDEGIALPGPGVESHVGVPNAVGVHELQLMRLLLDTCATVGEAEATLLAAKDFYYFAPAQYLVADRTGRSFVYGYSSGRNVQHLVEGDGEPQIATNFELHRHRQDDLLFAAPLIPERNAFWRYRILSERIASHRGSFSVDDMRALSDAVSFPGLFEERVVRDEGTAAAGTDCRGSSKLRARTLWHSLYDQAAGTLGVRFYRGEDVEPDGRWRIRRSDDVTFVLVPSAASDPEAAR
jgi:hypothetical protein